MCKGRNRFGISVAAGTGIGFYACFAAGCGRDYAGGITVFV